LRLVNPYEVAFREAKSAVGAAGLLASAREFSCLAHAVYDCTLVVGTTGAAARELQHPIRRLEAGAHYIDRNEGRTALLFGSEKYGLSNADLSHCHWLMRIPTREEHASMNLGQAVAVCLYELIRQPAATVKLQKQPATAEELERISERLMTALSASGYLNSRTSASDELKVRRFVRRLAPSAKDAEILLGMLRQILWKLGVRE
jgi:tRNA/rRNA methyltransferase